MRDDCLFDEARLRRALRLDATELPARLDAAAIAARAEAARPIFAVASLASSALACAAAAVLIAMAAVALPAIAPVFAAEAFGAGITTLARLAVPASDLLELAQQPTIPIATLAATLLALAYEYAQRKERVDGVPTS